MGDLGTKSYQMRVHGLICVSLGVLVLREPLSEAIRESTANATGLL